MSRVAAESERYPDRLTCFTKEEQLVFSKSSSEPTDILEALGFHRLEKKRIRGISLYSCDPLSPLYIYMNIDNSNLFTCKEVLAHLMSIPDKSKLLKDVRSLLSKPQLETLTRWMAMVHVHPADLASIHRNLQTTTSIISILANQLKMVHDETLNNFIHEERIFSSLEDVRLAIRSQGLFRVFPNHFSALEPAHQANLRVWAGRSTASLWGEDILQLGLQGDHIGQTALLETELGNNGGQSSSRYKSYSPEMSATRTQYKARLMQPSPNTYADDNHKVFKRSRVAHNDEPCFSIKGRTMVDLLEAPAFKRPVRSKGFAPKVDDFLSRETQLRQERLSKAIQEARQLDMEIKRFLQVYDALQQVSENPMVVPEMTMYPAFVDETTQCIEGLEILNEENEQKREWITTVSSFLESLAQGELERVTKAD
jgi:hypothetical protein